MPVEISRNVTINVDMSADEWELYSRKDGAEAAARLLNQTLTDLVQRHPAQGMSNAIVVHGKMTPLMTELREFGADDSEPLFHLKSIIATIYQIDSDEVPL